MAHTIAQAKERIWADISQAIVEIWPSIQIIFEQEELINKCQVAIDEVKQLLKDKPCEATDMTKVLNSKRRTKLEKIQILEKKKKTIFEIKKVLQRKKFMTQLETKCQALRTSIQRFHFKFNLLNHRGMPRLVAPNDRLIIFEDY